MKPDSPQGESYQKITFETNQNAESVLKFYKDHLTKEGWKETTWPDQPRTRHEFTYGGGPFYVIKVEVKETSPSQTYVVLDLLTEYAN